MSSNRVLRQPVLGPELRLTAPDPAALDPIVRDRVDQAAQRAYVEGHAAGVAEGRRLALEAAEQLSAAIRASAEEASLRLLAARQERASEVIELAMVVATAVIGQQPHDDGRALLGRVHESLEQLDDEPLTVFVSPDDLDYVQQGLTGFRGVTVLPDERIAPGDGQIEGPWSYVDLSVGAALEAIREALR